MERVVLVHGSVVGGRQTWTAQRRGLASRFELVVLERRGFPPGPPVERVDFDDEAVWLADQLVPGDHLVGHSYGGVVCLLAAALVPARVRSLAVLEPPCTRVALGDPAADAFGRTGADWWEHGPTGDPEAFLRGFLQAVGSGFDPPSPLPPDLEQGAIMLARERGPWYADVPLDALAAAPFPKLVITGGHHPGFEAIGDALERALPAERLVLRGYGHNVQLHPQANPALADFVERAV
jgi:pimeloyl-ACP methyl ester carboxylesterase